MAVKRRARKTPKAGIRGVKGKRAVANAGNSIKKRNEALLKKLEQGKQQVQQNIKKIEAVRPAVAARHPQRVPTKVAQILSIKKKVELSPTSATLQRRQHEVSVAKRNIIAEQRQYGKQLALKIKAEREALSAHRRADAIVIKKGWLW